MVPPSPKEHVDFKLKVEFGHQVESRLQCNEKGPSLNQFTNLGWVIDLRDMKQALIDRHRESFTDIEWSPVLRGQCKVINWLADNRTKEGFEP